MRRYRRISGGGQEEVVSAGTFGRHKTEAEKWEKSLKIKLALRNKVESVEEHL